MPNIVLVDEIEERRGVSRELINTGHRIFEASDAGVVIRMVNENLHMLKIDAIIMDSQGPTVYGFDPVTYFRTTYPDVPLIAILPSPDIDLVNYYLGMGVKDFLIKPIMKSSLLKAVNKVAVRVNSNSI